MTYYAKLTNDGKTIYLPVTNYGVLNCYYQGLIGDLETNATEVYCNNNQLTSLNCPNATEVNCWYNQLTSLICPNATSIHCYNNQLTELNCPNATKVYCWYNQLTSLICPNATEVCCSNNQLTSLICPNATEVCCSNNQLTNLNCPNIKMLYSDVLTLNGKLSIGIDGVVSEIVSTKTSGDYTIYLDSKGRYIAVKGKWSAHAKTVKEAISECVFKEENETKDKAEIVARIKEKGTVNWLDYRLLTGSCRMMTLEFLNEKGLSEDDEVSIGEAISLTEGRFGSEQFKTLVL